MGLTPKIGASLGMDPKMGELWSRLHFGDLWGLTPILGIFQVDPKLGGIFWGRAQVGASSKADPKLGELRGCPQMGDLWGRPHWGIFTAAVFWAEKWRIWSWEAMGAQSSAVQAGP